MSNENNLPYAVLPVSKNLAMIVSKDCCARIVHIEGGEYRQLDYRQHGTFERQVAIALAIVLNRKSILGYDKLSDGERKGLGQWHESLEAGKPFRPDWWEFSKLVAVKETNLPAKV